METRMTKQRVYVRFDSLFGGDQAIDALIQAFVNKKAAAMSAGLAKIHVRCEENEGFLEYVIMGFRAETDDEYSRRIHAEEKDRSRRKEQYERLKKEFEE
jgi:hypothetical protein